MGHSTDDSHLRPLPHTNIIVQNQSCQDHHILPKRTLFKKVLSRPPHIPKGIIFIISPFKNAKPSQNENYQKLSQDHYNPLKLRLFKISCFKTVRFLPIISELSSLPFQYHLLSNTIKVLCVPGDLNKKKVFSQSVTNKQLF